MKLITSIFLTALLTFAVGLFELPWWSFAITTFVVFVSIPQHAGKSFLAAFVTLFLLWAVIALKIDFANEHLLSKKVAGVLPLNGSYILLILLTAFIGGIVAGMSGLTGSLLRSSLKKQRRYN